MIVAGLVAGRLWAIPLGGVAWAGFVAIGGDCDWGCVPLATVFGAANTAVGVAIHLAVRLPMQALVRRAARARRSG
jgi:hypothetical protein